MRVAQLLDELAKMPDDAVVLIESGGAFARVATLEFIAGQGPAAPDEVILHPDTDE
jgi:hypothetical protein